MRTGVTWNKGFTLIELMLVSAIIGLLATIAIPKFANMIIKAKEATVRAKLGTLRSAVSIYYADNEGNYPTQKLGLDGLTLGGKYLDKIPEISIPTAVEHIADNRFCFQPAFWGDWTSPFPGPAAWRYYTLTGPGSISVNCTHSDSRGVVWSVQ